MPRILLVDDDPDIREMLTFKLRNAGFEAFSEADGESGLAAARELRPDLLLLDWMMPGLTGPEVCQRLREDPETADMPIVLLSARAHEADVQRGFATGADDYIPKPFSPRELVERVNALLARLSKSSA
jgi:DNA-binding response OmpR family regulator